MNKENNTSVWKYAGLATQFFVAIGIAVYGGLKLDEWMKLNTPVAVWVLPLLFITVMIFKIVKDTTPKK